MKDVSFVIYGLIFTLLISLQSCSIFKGDRGEKGIPGDGAVLTIYEVQGGDPITDVSIAFYDTMSVNVESEGANEYGEDVWQNHKDFILMYDRKIVRIYQTVSTKKYKVKVICSGSRLF